MAPIKFISLEGNIAAGKSTMINNIKELYPVYKIIDEPVDLWTSLKNEDGQNLLELFYKDKERWSYTFQYTAFFTRYLASLKAIQAAQADPQIEPIILLTERSILTDRNVFALMLKDQKCMTQIEWDLYMIWYDHFAKDIHVDAIVYLETNDASCSARIKHRGRHGEDNIPLDYLESLKGYHEAWISSTSIPVLRLSNNSKDEIEQLKTFVDSLLNK